MSDSDNEIELGLQQIDKAITNNVLHYLKTGDFPNKKVNAYMIAYSVVHRYADNEDDSSKLLFDYYNKTIISYMKDTVTNRPKENKEKLIDFFLKENSQCKILIYWMRKVFTYLDKFYTKTSNMGSLFSNATKNYFNYMFAPIKLEIVSAINSMIEDHRECRQVDIYKIVNSMRILEECDYKNPILNKVDDSLYYTGISVNGVIKDWFDKSFCDFTRNYVSNKAKTEISTLSAPEYIRSGLKYLAEEDERKSKYIHRDFHNKLDDINHKFLIDDNCRVIAKMDTGIRYMFINKKDTELKEVFTLFIKSKDSLKAITEIMAPYIKERGEEIYNNKELSRDPTKFIPILIKLKQEIDLLVEKSFDNHILFQDCKNKAFSHFMNKEIYSKQLANFCDFEMKIGIKGANDNQIEEKLNNIINIFKCLNNKIIFQFEYAKKLSDRLVSGKSNNLVAEKMLVTKLKAEQGVTFVNKMTSMMQDLDTSRAEMDNFRQQKHRGNLNGISFNSQVLQNGAWEIDKSKFDKLTIPKILSSCLDTFNTFYLQRHKTHKLMWVYGLGNMEIQYLYLKKPYQSVSTLIQYNVLINLEKAEKSNVKELSINELSGKLGYDPAIVAIETTSLLYHGSFNPKRNPKTGVISHDRTDNLELKPENKVWLNKEFLANSLKINTIPSVIKVSFLYYF